MIWIYSVLLQGTLTFLLDVAHTNGQRLIDQMTETGNSNCCNGILGYAWHRPFFPCAEMRCCNSSETVALATVNHAVGFCFRCMPKVLFTQNCYNVGQEVATTKSMTAHYELRSCCEGAKFKVIANTKETAMVIRCVSR